MSLGSIIGGVVGGVVGFFVGGPMGMVYGFAVGFMGGMMLDPMTPDLPSVGAPDIQQTVMSSEVGVPVKDLAGTAKIVGHLLIYGNERTEPIYQSSEGGGGKGGGDEPEPQVTGHKHFMTWAVGVCAGPVDSIYTIIKNEDVVWEGELDFPSSGGQETITLEGMGSCTFYFGSTDQVANSLVGDLIGDDTLNSPLRGFCWCVFEDCYIGDYPRCPTMKFIIKKIPEYSFESNTATIQKYDANPMHIIWFILNELTELPDTWLHSGDFEDAAVTLFIEARGLSVLFDTQQTALDYLQSVNMHIDNILRYGADGKFHPKLIRDDYDTATIPNVDENVILDDPTMGRRSWIDTLNEVKVQYTELIATRPDDTYSIVGGYAPGITIAWSPAVGGSLGRYVVGGTVLGIFYSDDGGYNWTNYADPFPSSLTFSCVRWIPELDAYIATGTSDHLTADLLAKSLDGINWVIASGQLNNNDYFSGDITYSTRTGRLLLVSSQGGSVSRVHTSIDGSILVPNVAGVGLYQLHRGQCEFKNKHYIFSYNYNAFLECAAPDTDLSTWVAADPSPLPYIAAPRSRIITDGNVVMAYSGCVFDGSTWRANLGSIGWQAGDWYADRFVFLRGVGPYAIYRSLDGYNLIEIDANLNSSINWEDVAVGADRAVAIGYGGPGLCNITIFTG